jgi:hypothetical protein
MTPEFDPSTVEGWIRLLAIPVYGLWSAVWKPSPSRQMVALRVLATWTIVGGLIVEEPAWESESHLTWTFGICGLVCVGIFQTLRAISLLSARSGPPTSNDSDIPGSIQ